MKKALTDRSRWSVVVVGIVLVGLIGGGAYAASRGGGSGTIRACAHKGSGALRLAHKCKRHERRVSWSITGPQGPGGPQGPPGSPGSAIAYAHVFPGGSLDAAHSKNVSASARVSPATFGLKV